MSMKSYQKYISIVTASLLLAACSTTAPKKMLIRLLRQKKLLPNPLRLFKIAKTQILRQRLMQIKNN